MSFTFRGTVRWKGEEDRRRDQQGPVRQDSRGEQRERRSSVRDDVRGGGGGTQQLGRRSYPQRRAVPLRKGAAWTVVAAVVCTMDDRKRGE